MSNRVVIDLVIDPEFKALIPPLQPEEFALLERNILEAGVVHDTLKVWSVGKNQILLDGHNRKNIADKHGIKYRLEEIKRDSRDHAKLWIQEQQLGRRNLTDSQRAMFAADVLELRSKLARSKQASIAGQISGYKRAGRNVPATLAETLKSKDQWADTRKAVAAEASVSTKKVRYALEIKKADPALAEKVRRGEITLFEAGRQVRKTKILESLESVEAMTAKKIEGKFDVIVSDPPWPVTVFDFVGQRGGKGGRGGKGAPGYAPVMPYPLMELPDIYDLLEDFLSKHAAKNCHFFLWTTQKLLPDAFKIIERCNLEYVCTFVWHKAGGPQPVELPQYNCEFAVYARLGKPKFIDTKQFFTCFEADRGEHSEKPQIFYDILRRVTAGRRLDMFNRRPIDGFEGWGKEAPAKPKIENNKTKRAA